ncbi:hypothetical protein P3T76_005478 [Phytophthora citrophthora]|uniref:Uncharacterized protein n=1 Tax=Phytophthora citrophthora TaxID=4793 RepID=A0AAD9GRI0_9STRA|nr:hypothetical protein P3T76_005478 [Phytophthora citrophthora]
MEAPPVRKMDSKTHLPTFTLAIYVGLLAGLVVVAVAFTMLRVYAYRHRLSTVTISASYDADADGALIATTLSSLGSPLPSLSEEPRGASSKMSTFSSFGNRWQLVKSFVSRVRQRGLSVWSSLCLRLQSGRKSKTAASNAGTRVSQAVVEIATPCNTSLKSPVTPNPSSQYASQLSSKFQLSLFHSPKTNDIGII